MTKGSLRREEFILAYSRRGGVYNGEGAMAAEEADRIFNHKHKTESELAELSKPACSELFPALL